MTLTGRRLLQASKCITLLIGFCLSIQAQSNPAVRLYPVDDTAREPRFRSYVRKLQAAVDARSTGALRKLVDKDVVVGPADEDKGWTKFLAKWRPDDGGNSKVWIALSDLLSLGFIQEHPTLFLSPYLVWRFPRGLSIANPLVVIRDKVALRHAPSANAPSAGSLSFDIVQQLGEPQGAGGLVQWVPVRALDGISGYVSTRDVMSPSMPRAQFGIRERRWLLIALEGPDQ